jgi:hypothetical protein
LETDRTLFSGSLVATADRLTAEGVDDSSGNVDNVDDALELDVRLEKSWLEFPAVA